MAQDQSEQQFNASVARLLHKEALRRAARDLNPTFGTGLEGVLATISAQATAQAAEKIAARDAATGIADKIDVQNIQQTPNNERVGGR